MTGSAFKAWIDDYQSIFYPDWILTWRYLQIVGIEMSRRSWRRLRWRFTGRSAAIGRDWFHLLNTFDEFDSLVLKNKVESEIDSRKKESLSAKARFLSLIDLTASASQLVTETECRLSIQGKFDYWSIQSWNQSALFRCWWWGRWGLSVERQECCFSRLTLTFD